MTRLSAFTGLVLMALLFDAGSLAQPNPACDVNDDGWINGADVLEIRKPENWGKSLLPTPAPIVRKVVSYSGPPESTAYDIRNSGTILADLDIRSTQRGIVADEFWAALGVNGLLIDDCSINTVSYGLYTGISGVTVLRTTFNASQRDPVRITNGNGVTFEDCVFSTPAADVAVRVHGNASRVTFRRCVFHCWSWGIDIGEQYRGAGGCVKDVLLEDCTFIASPHTIHGVRVRAQGVRLVRCIGKGFDKALPGASLVTFEQHSCEPTGGAVIGCSCEGRPVIKQRWSDTEVK